MKRAYWVAYTDDDKCFKEVGATNERNAVIRWAALNQLDETKLKQNEQGSWSYRGQNIKVSPAYLDQDES